MKVKTMQIGKSRKVTGPNRSNETWLTVKLEYEELIFTTQEIDEADRDLEIILDKLETTERVRWRDADQAA